VREVDLVSGASAHDHAMAVRSMLAQAARETAEEARAAGDDGGATWLTRFAARIAPPR